VGSGYSTVNVSATLNNLLPGTTYYYRIDSENQFGTSHGSTLTFTTQASSVNTSVNTTVTNSGTNSNSTLASILTSMNRVLVSMANASNNNANNNANQASQSSSVSVAVASAPTTSEAVNGTVSPNGSDTTAYFVYGPTTSFGYRTAAQDMGSGTVTVPISANLTGLIPNTTYYYRVVGSNAYGSGGGTTHSFTTNGGTITSSATSTAAQNSSNTTYTASIFSALGGSWTIIGLIILVLIAIGVVVFLRFVLK
jgi:hypothetical protein